MFKRHYPATNNTVIDDPSSSSEDEDHGLNPFNEDEQERALSERHGEAKEDAGPGSKVTSTKKESDKDIANALNSTETKKKRQRITLTEDKLTDGENGIIRIRHEFPSKIRYRPVATSMNGKKISKKKKLELEIKSAAAYTSKLMNAYNSFAMDLMPTSHPTDTLLKIRDLGSKKKVRDYLDLMRQDICMGHLKTVYGKDKATKYVDELNSGLEAHNNFDELNNGLEAHDNPSNNDGSEAINEDEEKEFVDEGPAVEVVSQKPAESPVESSIDSGERNGVKAQHEDKNEAP